MQENRENDDVPSDTTADVRALVLEALRAYAVRYQESAHQLAVWMGLPTSDGTALGEVIWAEQEGHPLSPARLSERLGMTSGATNALVNRLERQGLVSRSRESTDRRIVSLRVTPSARERTSAYLEGPQRELAAALDEYDDATLEVVREFLDRFAAVLPGGGQPS